MTDRLNELLYKKSILEKRSHYTQINRRDKKFYRKRILNLTRELFLSSDAGNDDINDAFMNYVYYCIEHFKHTDMNDILQGEYADFDDDDGCGCDHGLGHDHADAAADADAGADADVEDDNDMTIYNYSMMRKIVKPNTLDNFIIRNVIKKNDAEHLPIQKEINLKDPQLRVKGIVKKKNLMNTYEKEENTEDNKEKQTDENTEENREKQTEENTEEETLY